mmetsp:Transcript_11462/g.41962  ORF Transcript_11462/g.41962 Transcript_11462/m.41962 type:complete len:148 (+) Transcript_11462:219-662(+)
MEDKVRRYEQFLEELKKDLAATTQAREKVLRDIDVYTELSRSLAVVENSCPSTDGFKCQMNLGGEVYVGAKVEDTSYVYVDVGLGFYPAMTFDEAREFCKQKEALLAKRVETLDKQVASVKSHIKLVGEGIKELMGLRESFPEDTRY